MSKLRNLLCRLVFIAPVVVALDLAGAGWLLSLAICAGYGALMGVAEALKPT